jgi:hypothetical protein
MLGRCVRQTYRGLNLRFAAVQGQRITPNTGPTNGRPCMAWAQIAGTFAGAPSPAAMIIFQSAQNPCYPGDWVQYPNLNWLQPTFLASGTRYKLEPDHPLILRFRLWIHSGPPASDESCADEWRAYDAAVALQ